MELQGQRRGNLNYLLDYADKLKLKKSMEHWFWYEFIFSLLFIACIISQLMQNRDGGECYEASFFILEFTSFGLMTTFIVCKHAFIYRRLVGSPIKQTRARLKVTECVQAFAFTIINSVGVILLLQGAWAGGEWSEHVFNWVVGAAYGLYSLWWALLTVVYTFLLIATILFCKTKIISDTLKELNCCGGGRVPQNALQDNYVIDDELLAAILNEEQNQALGANNNDGNRDNPMPNSPERFDRLIRQSSQQLRLNRQSSTGPILARMARVFDRAKFYEHTECIICLEEFKATDRVTPLPCNTRHYFHSKCIEQWNLKQKFCPLCNTPFTIQELSEYDKKYSLLCAEDFNKSQEEEKKEPFFQTAVFVAGSDTPQIEIENENIVDSEGSKDIQAASGDAAAADGD